MLAVALMTPLVLLQSPAPGGWSVATVPTQKSANVEMSMSSSPWTLLVGRHCDVIFCHLEPNEVVGAPFKISGEKSVVGLPETLALG